MPPRPPRSRETGPSAGAWNLGPGASADSPLWRPVAASVLSEPHGAGGRVELGLSPLAIVCPQLGVKALTYDDLIQAQKEISAHNQQLREQTEQLEKDNRELRGQSLQLVRAGGCASAARGWGQVSLG